MCLRLLSWVFDARLQKLTVGRAEQSLPPPPQLLMVDGKDKEEEQQRRRRPRLASAVKKRQPKVQIRIQAARSRLLGEQLLVSEPTPRPPTLARRHEHWAMQTSVGVRASGS